MVQRYRPVVRTNSNGSKEIIGVGDDKGHYVLHYEYDALKAKLDALVKYLKERNPSKNDIGANKLACTILKILKGDK